MSFPVVWLTSAVEDLRRLRKFIQEHHPKAASQAANKLQEAAKTLSEYPSLGKPVIDLPEYRELGIRFGVGGYLLRYRVHTEKVYVVHLRHYRESPF